jgi:hypothetical protein
MRLGEEYEEFSNMNLYFKGDKRYEKRKLDEFKQLDVDRKNYKIEVLKMRERAENEERQKRN